jgi:FdhD protein
MQTPAASKTKNRVWVVENGKVRSHTDSLVTEEPLEIRLIAGGVRRTVAVTMRTPGNDFELAAGFLYTEGVIASRHDIRRISYCVNPDTDGSQRYNILNVQLHRDTLPDLATLERHFYTTSACGICGKTSLEALRLRGCSAIPPGPAVSAQILCTLPEKLQQSQRLFQRTGGLHAAALFTPFGELLTVCEDVGRHNALDKLIGSALLSERLPLSDCILMVSGRSSFEILQKSLAAGIPIVCAVSAASSLAVQLAEDFGITLIGFLRGERFNVYSGIDRVIANP